MSDTTPFSGSIFYKSGFADQRGVDTTFNMLYTVTVVYKTTMTVTTNEHGQMNLFAKEPTMYYENYGMLTPSEVKERTNGRWAMMGFVAGIASYVFTGNFFFGIF